MQSNATDIFVNQIARLTLNHECSNCGGAGDRPNPECAEHQPFSMKYDDAVDTVHGLIVRAREIANKSNNAAD